MSTQQQFMVWGALIFLPCMVNAEPLISLSIKPYPTQDDHTYAKEVSKKLNAPYKLAEKTINGIVQHNPAQGIFATYAGYLTVSDYNGQIMFPRKSTQTTVYLLVTPEVTPVIMAGQTLNPPYWQLQPYTPAQLYRYEQKTDAQTGLMLWNVTEAQLPKDLAIPLATIIIFAKPTHIYVPLGYTPMNASEHLILPPLYAKKGINMKAHALYLLNIKQYFGRLARIYNKGELGYATHIIY